MRPLIPDWPFLNQVLDQIQSNGKMNPVQVKTTAGFPYFLMRLALAGPSLLIFTDEEHGAIHSQDLKSIAAVESQFAQWSIGFFSENFPKENMALIEDFVEKSGNVWFCSKEFLNQPMIGKGQFLSGRIELKVGKIFPYAAFLRECADRGYRRVEFVEETGEIAVRGEVVDFWSPNHARPVRIVYSADTLESLHTFDPYTQRTVEIISRTVVVPLKLKEKNSEPKIHPIFSYFPQDSILVLDHLSTEEKNQLRLVSPSIPTLEFGLEGLDLAFGPASRIQLNWKVFKKELEDFYRDGIKSFVFCQNMGEAQRLEDLLDELRCFGGERPQIFVDPLSAGFVSRGLKIAVWSFSDMVGTPSVIRGVQKFRSGRMLDSIAEVISGDYIVHERFGIGRYRGLKRMGLKIKSSRPEVYGKEKMSEFLELEYKNGDRLFVPIQDFRLVQKYVGQEGKRPQLHSLDGAAWERIKQNVKEEIEKLAQELLMNTALRKAVNRFDASQHPVDRMGSELEKEFAEAFPYEETPDQLRAAEEISRDLDSGSLMDRLVCGDVGYGKTEVAMRASFKVVCRSKQVAVLVPTTILAEQHFKNFSDRFAAFPVKIGMISRFQKPSEQKRILASLKEGVLDIVIGTHRLLQKDVGFKDLGLVIIDEEHRFGVEQKETLKKIKLNADVLALSATPIPRTLSLSLGGVRDISIIETAPEGRLPIETTVHLYDDKILKEAVGREIARGGQIFYVHNRVSTIHDKKKELEKIFPNLKVGIAHGQMSADALEKAMWNFLHQKWDLLLSTTIIESGLDIPNVNTLIVEECQDFGLAQLYQLRGRVGRKKEKAACVLFFSDLSKLGEDAQKRLQAIQEFSALGSGVKLALRDMEIRGVGNFLGDKQHGWVNAVGLEMYCQILSGEIERVKKEKGISSKGPTKAESKGLLPEIELQLSAYIPEEYIPSPGERIAFYKRIANTKNEAELDLLKAELLDRFGIIPEVLMDLLRIMRLRILAGQARVCSMIETVAGIRLGWESSKEDFPLDLSRMAQDLKNQIEILPPKMISHGRGIIEILFNFKSGGPEKKDPLKIAEEFLQISLKYVNIQNL